jgi:hypothetical protein
MVQQGEVSRVSSVERSTKAIIFKNPTGRNSAVEVNDTISRAYARQVMLVFEGAPGGLELDWESAALQFEAELVAISAEVASSPPSQIVPTLPDRGQFLASESTVYRILKTAKQ